MHFYVDDEIEADSLDEARSKGAALAEEAWHREVAWQAELAACPPCTEPSARTIEFWNQKLVDAITQPITQPSALLRLHRER